MCEYVCCRKCLEMFMWIEDTKSENTNTNQATLEARQVI